MNYTKEKTVSGFRSAKKIYRTSVILAVMCVLTAQQASGSDIERIYAIASKLAAVAGQDAHIVVEDAAKPDAYLHPMGYIVITSGMLGLFEDDADIAFIIGHELAHSIRGHYNGGSEILGIARDIYLPEKLWKEIDADAYSLKIIKAAGYEPAASLRVLMKLWVNEIGQSSTYTEKRINALIADYNN